MSASKKIEEILNIHHAYLKSELPKLTQFFESIQVGVDQLEALQKLQQTFLTVCEELEKHIAKEEAMLFPSISHIETALESGQRPDLSKHDIRESLDQAEVEHDATAQSVAQMIMALEKLGQGASFQTLSSGLQELAADLKKHVEAEEKDLFPQARFLYAKATQGMLREE